MTDKELIQALRDEDITDVRDMMDCMEAAADRLEFLLRECAELKLQIQKEICKRVDVEAENERLKAGNDTNVSTKRGSPTVEKG